MFDDNATSIIIALIALVTVIVNLGFGFLTLRLTRQAAVSSQAAVVSSQANAAALEVVHNAVNGLTQARVDVEQKIGDVRADAEQRVGEAKATAAHAEGRIEEMKAAQP